jgi:hypothetical protein
MFHLLVSYAAWPEGAGSIGSSRVYIYPNEAPGNIFLKDGKLDLAQVTKIPALLVHEIGSTAPQMARVAHITNVTQGPRETAIQYAIDNSIRPISNSHLEAFASQLGVTKSVLSHTHWTIKDVDLFKVLLMNQQKNATTPKVFSGDSIGQQDATLVSVMMPFAAEFNPVYAAIQSAVATNGLRCVRADNFWEHATVIQDIFNLIARARLVICDCSGRNPNVFYEAGIAHTLGKEVIIVTQSENDIPFDLRHLRYVHYLNNDEGRQTLTQAVRSRIYKLLSG